MLCEQCKQREANTHIRRVINGEAEEHYLCAECARETGAMPTLPHLGDFGFHLGDLFSSFLGDSFGSQLPQALPPGERCPFCGSSLAEIARDGRVGCATCYETFYDQLKPTLQRIHGGLQHSGKAPASDPAAERENQRRAAVERLRENIAAAVQAEKYEEAAKLRDEIRALEEGGEAQ
jgi:protein arginine kinase activator